MKLFEDLYKLAVHDLQASGVKKYGRVKLTRQALVTAGLPPHDAYAYTANLPFKLEAGQKLKDVVIQDLIYILDTCQAGA